MSPLPSLGLRLFALLALLPACQPSSPSAAPTELGEDPHTPPALIVEAEVDSSPLARVRAQPVEGLVAHPPLAQFYSRPAADAGLPRLEETDTQALYAWRVIADEGEFVTVESLASDEQAAQCLGGIYTALRNVFDSYALRLNLRRRDLQLVVAEQTRIDYDDGSGLTIASGVPVVHIGGRAWLSVYGIEHVTPLLGQELSLSWSGGGLVELELPEPMPPVHYPALELNAEVVRRDTWEWPYHLVRSIEPLNPGSRRMRWHFGGPCLAIDLVGPPLSNAPGIGHGRGVGMGGMGYGGNPRLWNIPEGSASQWPDGSDAGVTRVELRRLARDVEEDGERICYSLVDELRICHLRADVTLVE